MTDALPLRVGSAPRVGAVSAAESGTVGAVGGFKLAQGVSVVAGMRPTTPVALTL